MRGGGARVFLHSHCLLQHLGCLRHRGQRCLATRALLLEREEGCQRSINIHIQLILPCMPADQGLSAPQTGAEARPSGPKGTWQTALVDKKIVYGLVGSRDGDSALSQGRSQFPWVQGGLPEIHGSATGFSRHKGEPRRSCRMFY